MWHAEQLEDGPTSNVQKPAFIKVTWIRPISVSGEVSKQTKSLKEYYMRSAHRPGKAQVRMERTHTHANQQAQRCQTMTIYAVLHLASIHSALIE